MEIKTEAITELLRQQIEKFDLSVDVAEVGEVIAIGDGVARVSGLENVMSSELVELPNGVFGMALNLEDDNVGLVLFGDSRKVKEGDLAKRTKRVIEVPVGDAMQGRVVNPLGEPLDGKGPIESNAHLPIERKALGVMQRQPVKQPLQTGIKAIDSMIPIGRGQRELIIGDRQTGKTAIAVDTIINQKFTHQTDEPVYCIYVAIGQKASTVATITAELDANGAMDYTTVVTASASDPAPMPAAPWESISGITVNTLLLFTMTFQNKQFLIVKCLWSFDVLPVVKHSQAMYFICIVVYLNVHQNSPMSWVEDL